MTAVAKKPWRMSLTDDIHCRPSIQGMLNRQPPKLGFHGADDSYSIVCGKPGNQVSCTEDFSKE